MVEYNLVKDCLMCRKKFVIPKCEFKRIYCNACQIKIKKK